MICGVFFWTEIQNSENFCKMLHVFLYSASCPELDPAVIEQRYALDHSMYPGCQDLTKTSKH